MHEKFITIDNNQIVIRKADVNDTAQLVELRIIQQKDDWKFEYVESDLFSKSILYLEKFLVDDENGLMLVAETHNQIIATCGLQIMNLMPQCNDYGRYGYLFNVFTINSFRNRGIQYELLSEIIDYSKECSITEISLETDNTAAIHLYKKVGFKENNLFMTKTIEL